MSPYIISLTTIPPRFAKIAPTLRDLVNQKAKPIEIRLNLSREYRRFPGELPSLPDLPEGVKIHWSETDYGPATKVLPTVEDWRGKDIDILFCDDDQIYKPNWSSQFLKHRTDRPGDCIAAQGYDLVHRPIGHRYNRDYTRHPRAERRFKGPAYRLFRTLTLGTIKPHAYVKNGYVDIMEGNRGVLIKPDFIPNEAFDIPDILWTVDDPWLSGHMERIGVPIWLMTDVKRPQSHYEAHSKNALYKMVYRDHGRIKADTACIDYFRDTYGIWPGWKESPQSVPKKNRMQQFLGKPRGFGSP